MSNLSNKPIIVIISTLAAIVAIIVFITGKDHFEDLISQKKENVKIGPHYNRLTLYEYYPLFDSLLKSKPLYMNIHDENGAPQKEYLYSSNCFAFLCGRYEGLESGQKIEMKIEPKDAFLFKVVYKNRYNEFNFIGYINRIIPISKESYMLNLIFRNNDAQLDEQSCIASLNFKFDKWIKLPAKGSITHLRFNATNPIEITREVFYKEDFHPVK